MKIKKIRNKKLGFTLVELIIVILIVIVLSSISGPIYRKYLVNTKVSEGYFLYYLPLFILIPESKLGHNLLGNCA